MEKLSLFEIVKATNGEVKGSINIDLEIDNISTDTRTIEKGSLFIPIVGDNFDGHNFIETARRNGATMCLSEKKITGNYIKVEDTKKALGMIAAYYLRKYNPKVIAITGSVGKTTTKDLLGHILSQKYNVVKTSGNLNNDIGVPKTIFNIDKNTEVLILEMGMSDFGEIEWLSKIANPDIALITKIGNGHTENLKDEYGVLQAKLEIVTHLKKDGTLILNGDDDLLNSYFNSSINIIRVGTNENSALQIKNLKDNGIDGLSFVMNNTTYKTNLMGKAQITNILLCIACAKKMNSSMEEIQKSLKNVKITDKRMQRIEKDSLTIINDAYNANPTSMMASLDALSNCTTKGNKIAILGDMLELGNNSIDFHKEIGQYINTLHIDKVITIGTLARNIYDTANINKEHYNSMDDIEELSFNKDDIILLKASRGMKLENLIDKIEGEE